MAANTSPVFLLTPNISYAKTSTSAVTGTDGTDANVQALWTAGTNGGRVNTVTICTSATNAATVVRFWINNGGSPGTATNNTLMHEETFAAVSLSQVAADASITWTPNLVLPAGYRLLVAAGTATSALYVTAIGGNY